MLWRVRQLASAAKLVDVSPPIYTSVTLTSPCQQTTDEGWRLWWTDPRSMEEPRWLSTPPCVTALHCDGSARRGTAERDGVPLDEARQRKERTYLELVQPDRRAKLVVIAGEVGERWSNEGSVIHQALGQGTRSRVTRGFEKTCRTSLAFEVVWPPNVCGGKGVCRFILERRPTGGCRW